MDIKKISFLNQKFLKKKKELKYKKNNIFFERFKLK
jgi:hypothetical protein